VRVRKWIYNRATNLNSISISKKTVKVISNSTIKIIFSQMIQKKGKAFNFCHSKILNRIHYFKLKIKAFHLKIHSKRLILFELVHQYLHAWFPKWKNNLKDAVSILKLKSLLRQFSKFRALKKMKKIKIKKMKHSLIVKKTKMQTVQEIHKSI
jgi:hypothetical protein